MSRAPTRLNRGAPALPVLCLGLGLLFAAPLAYLVRSGLFGPAGLGGLWDLYSSQRTLTPLWNSLLLAATTAVSTALVGTGLAWLTTRTDLPLRRLWASLAVLPLVFPSFVGSLALLAAVGPGGLLAAPLEAVGADPFRPEGFWGAWLVLTLFTTPLVFLPVTGRLMELSPSLEESARLLGRRPAEVFRSIVLPQVAPAVRAGALLVFLYTLSDFGVVVMLRHETLTRSIYGSRLLDPDRSLRLALLLAVLALIVVTTERYLARRHASSESVRTRHAVRYPLGPWRWPALGVLLLWVVCSLGLPLASLGLWAWRGMQGKGSRLAGSDGGFGGLVDPTVSTVWVSTLTAVVAVLAVLPVAYLGARRRGRVSDVVHGLVATGFGLPGLVVGLAVVSWVVDLPRGIGLYQSYTLLVATYVIHLGAQALRPAQAVVSAMPARLEEAAQMLGAGRWRRFLTIEAPLMLPGLAAAGGLVLLSTMKELPITLLVSPLGFSTLATRIWDHSESAFLAEAGLASLVLVAFSGLLTWLLVLRRIPLR